MHNAVDILMHMRPDKENQNQAGNDMFVCAGSHGLSWAFRGILTLSWKLRPASGKPIRR